MTDDGQDASAFTLRIIQRVREIPAATWDAIVAAGGPDASPFVEHAWLDALEETGCVGGETGWTPAHLTLWRGESLIAACPSYLKTNSEGEFVFDWAWADFAARAGIRYYPKVVVAVPFTPATGNRVLVAPGEDRGAAMQLLAAAARQWCTRIGGSSVHLLFPRADEADAFESAGYLRRDGFQFQWFREGAASFDDYLGRFSSKHRHQIKREIREVDKLGIDVRTLSPEEHTHEAARTMFEFYESTIDKHGMWGRLYLSLPFFERLVDVFRDRLAWVIARDRATGTPIGGAFNVAGRSRLYGRYWGARADVPFLHFVVCYYAGVRHAIERGLDVFEPGAGGEHKRPRGFEPTRTRSAHWIADPRLRSALGPWLAHERARIAQIVEE
ncbi:MAG: GNAT family N-acetyltransferase [Polyangiaceae bacterium]